MKKYLFGAFLSLLFLAGVVSLYSYKVEAGTVTATITASSTRVQDGTWVSISYRSTGATSCTTNFNSSTATSGDYGYTASKDTPSRYFYVNCTNGMVYYQLSPCNSGNIAAEYYTSAGSWSSGTLVQGATGVFYHIAGSNENDDPSKTNVAGITSGYDPSLCR